VVLLFVCLNSPLLKKILFNENLFLLNEDFLFLIFLSIDKLYALKKLFIILEAKSETKIVFLSEFLLKKYKLFFHSLVEEGKCLDGKK
jgi:hypothetical protein